MYRHQKCATKIRESYFIINNGVSNDCSAQMNMNTSFVSVVVSPRHVAEIFLKVLFTHLTMAYTLLQSVPQHVN
eukprot:jgi/Antlo1/2318/2188